MERREQARRPRRVQVRFWERGSEKSYKGYSANISTGGMYVDTNHLAAKGTRVRLEVCSGEDGFMIEAVVARVKKSLHALRPSGMGVRFLGIAELVGELIPEIAPAAAGSAAVEPSLAEQQIPLPAGSFRLRFASGRQFMAVYERDLSTGGLFIPTDRPAALNQIVTVELSVDEPGVTPVRFQARVVHRLDPKMPEGTGGGNLMAGMGVELMSFEQTLKALWGLVAQLQG